MKVRHDLSQTKIIATIGPACRDKDTLRKMFYAGIDVCRINFSHDSLENHLKVIKTIRELNSENNFTVAIMGDLQGPKLRIGMVEEGTLLIEGREIDFITSEDFMGNADKVFMSYKDFPKDVKIGDTILIDDGKIKLQAVYTNKKDIIKAKVIYGGILNSKKGVNLPDTSVSLPSLTEKDKKDAEFALDNDVDWIALSFVRSGKDMLALKNLIKEKKKNAGVIAKIEKPEALKDINNIIDLSDGLMIARGDLGVEVPFDQVPLIQKELVKLCIKNAKPVIIATQMMESMITNFRPTRAEANDVANAVLDGADTVMLSGETSVGKFPVEAIINMQKIIDYTEGKGFETIHENIPQKINQTFLPASLCYTATNLAKNTHASAIILFTHSGYTAFRVSSHRPRAKIFAFTRNKRIINRLSLLWGVRAFFYDQELNIVDSIEYSTQFLKEKGLIKKDEVVVHLGSSPIEEKGQTNTLKLSYVIG